MLILFLLGCISYAGAIYAYFYKSPIQLIDHHTQSPMYTYPIQITSDLEKIIHNILEPLYTNNLLFYYILIKLVDIVL